MNRERKGDTKQDKSDLWSSYPHYYQGPADSDAERCLVPLIYQGSVLSPVSLNVGAEPLLAGGGRSASIKHQPYLDTRAGMNDPVLHGVFADSPLDEKPPPLGFSQLVQSAYGADGHPISMHGIVSTAALGLGAGNGVHNNPAGLRSPDGGASSCGSSSGGSSRESSSRRVRHETAGQRQERLRKNAERGKLRRMVETEEQRQRRLARNAERGKLRRMEESPDKRSDRLRKNAERQKVRRSRETPEERQLRLWKNAERQRIRRSTGTGIKVEYPDYGGGLPEHLL